MQFSFYKFLILFFIIVSPSVVSHNISIDDCRCDTACYSKEVFALKCDSTNVQFQSQGIPLSHPLMEGITGSNQQFPSPQNYLVKIPLNQTMNTNKIYTEPGAIGIAINGIPLFDPQTQGAKDSSGKRTSALEKGELDECGGHAGRGDDYHYHIAPKCLIEELGEDFVENKKRPIGYANDGYPILALGWFDAKNNIEKLLDECRGMYDINKNYFYNVKKEYAWNLIDCFSGKVSSITKDKGVQRIDKNGKKIVGLPIKYQIDEYEKLIFNNQECDALHGKLLKASVVQDNGIVKKIINEYRSIFYCSKSCYGLYFEAEKKAGIKGKTIFYDLVTNNCPKNLEIKD
tara:strand:- start:111 stop:1145 length:1035 start_codon:yes stop_codon:yes gene_type:complete